MRQGDAVDARMLLLSEQGFASVAVTKIHSLVMVALRQATSTVTAWFLLLGAR